MKAIFMPDVPLGTLALPYIHTEIYVDAIYNFLRGTKDLTILDIGANIGEVTRYIRQAAKKVYAIEPSPLEFEALRKNKEYNGWDNVEVFNLAISDKNGEMGFEVMNGNRTGNHLSEQGAIRVATVRLDDFLKEQQIDKVDFMKLDVEGAENAIIRNGFPHEKVDSMLIEFHNPGWMDLVHYIMDLGYKAHLMKTKADVYVFNR